MQKTLKDYIIEALEERKMVTFDNSTYPKYGWTVVLSGSGGSGKGYALRHNLPIDGKVLNVDHMKKLYNKYVAHGKYDMADPRDTNDLHNIVRNKGWKDIQRDSIFDSQSMTDYKSNLIFDITGRSYNELVDITGMAHDVGYKTAFVWVVCSEEKALERNKKRQRRVPDEILKNTRNQINSFLPRFLTQNGARFFDAAWIIFSSGVGNTEVPDEKDTTFQLVRNGNGFTLPNGIEDRLNSVLGTNV